MIGIEWPQIYSTVIFGPKVTTKRFFDTLFGSIQFNPNIVYLRNYYANVLIPSLQEKIINNVRGTRLELLALGTAHRIIKFDIAVFEKCMELVANKNLFDYELSLNFFDSMKKIYKNKLPSGYWPEFIERSEPMGYFRDEFAVEIATATARNILQEAERDKQAAIQAAQQAAQQAAERDKQAANEKFAEWLLASKTPRGEILRLLDVSEEWLRDFESRR
jgi:hypothetical protein